MGTEGPSLFCRALIRLFRRILISEYGPPLIEHVLLKQGFKNSLKITDKLIKEDVDKILDALHEAESIFTAAKKSPSKVSNNTAKHTGLLCL